MAKSLDPSEIEAARKTGSRAERRETQRQLMREEIALNQGDNGFMRQQ